jgi:beta-lactamase class D
MRLLCGSVLMLFALLGGPNAVQAQEICSIISNPKTQETLYKNGDCDRRVTPASTFKFALAVMGFELGVLTSPTAPSWPYKNGYPAWGGAKWKVDTNPTYWLENSVVWYSQVMAKQMGTEKLTEMAHDFGYGNADFSGDPGKNNGLERAWIASSLQISAYEQNVFLTKFLRQELGIKSQTYVHTKTSMPQFKLGGWTIYGKTGMAYPRMKNGQLDRNHPFGWFVGWAERGEERFVFVQLRQDPHKMAGSASVRARDTILSRLDELLPR